MDDAERDAVGKMLRERCFYVLSAFIIAMAYSNSAIAQSAVEFLSTGEPWKQFGATGVLEYRSKANEGIIIRPSDSGHSIERAVKEHMIHRIEEKAGRPLSPIEQEKAEAEIERYSWPKLQAPKLERSEDSKHHAEIAVQSEPSVKGRRGAAHDIARRLFALDQFQRGGSEEKWRLLREEVQRAALNPEVDITADDIKLREAASIADVIRQATPEQLGLLFDIGAWPEQDWLGDVTMQVVAPGTPVTGNGAFSGACTGSWCGSPRPGMIAVEDDLGRALITYREDAYEQVVVLQPGQIGFAKELDRCTATLIGRNWAVSALHCFGKKGKDIRHNFQIANGPIPGWLEFTADARSVFTVALKGKDKESLAFPVEKMYAPYVEAMDIRYGKGEVPPRDVALIMISGGEGTEFSKYPRFAQEGEGEVDSAVTFVGYGWTDIARKDWTKSKETAFNWLTEINNSELLWTSGNWGGNGGPCLGDSGGPIFLNFVRGFENENMRILGVVSALRSNGKIISASQCLGREGVGEPVLSIAADMCAITNGSAAGCQ